MRGEPVGPAYQNQTNTNRTLGITMKSKLEDRIWTPIASRLRGGTSSPPSIRLSVAFAFAFAFAFALAITLCGFSVTLYAPLKISLADIAIGSALLHALLHLRQARISSITLPMVVFAGILLLSGMITAWRFEYFDELNFAINFARIVAIVVIVALLPTFFRSMGYETMVRAVLWAFRVNAIVLLVDAVGLLPDVFSPSRPSLDRPTGFFLEPGWYSASISFVLFCLLYAETVLRRRYVNVGDVALFVLSVILSAGFRGILLLPLSILILLAMDMRMRSARTVISVPCAVIVLVAAAIIFPDSVVGRTVVHVQERADRVATTIINRTGVGAILSANPAEAPKAAQPPEAEKTPKARKPLDESSNSRFDATFGFIRMMVAERLFVGVGLGGNVINGYVFFTENTESDRFFSKTYNSRADRSVIASGRNGIGTVNSFDNILFAGGPLALLALILIIGWLVLNPDTRLFGISFLVVCLFWEPIFQLFVWSMVALAVALGQHAGECSDANQGFGRSLRRVWRIPFVSTGESPDTRLIHQSSRC